MISHAFWRDRFGGDPDILGKQFRAYVSDRPDEAETFTIVGVLAVDFLARESIYADFCAASGGNLSVHDSIARGNTRCRCRASNRRSGWGSSSSSISPRRIRAVAKADLFAIGSATGIVLVIAWANVAFLILIRTNRQQRDVAIRFALGAARGAVARTLITESLLLCATAAILSVSLATMLLTALGPVIQEQLGRPVPGGVSRLTIDLAVISIVIVLTIILACGLSLVPLVGSRRQSLMVIMRRGQMSGSNRTGANISNPD